MTNQTTIPVGTGLLSRVLNASGEPLDNKGQLENVQHVSLARPVVETSGQAQQMLETGIKVIDLLAPLPQGGSAGIFGVYGVGKIVVLDENIVNFIHHHNGLVVALCMDETYEASAIAEALQELDDADKASIATLYEPLSGGADAQRRLLLAGVTIAQQFQQAGRQVLLVADENTATKGTLEQVREWRNILRSGGVTTLFLAEYEDVETGRAGVLDNLDTRIILTRAMAQQSLWPAVDRVASISLLLTNGAVSAEHTQVAQQARQLLQRYIELHNVENSQSLSATDQEVLTRGERLQYFFMQPFFVAEAYTDIPGEYVPLSTTLTDVQAILDGRYDNIPAEAFKFIGSASQALAKAKQ